MQIVVLDHVWVELGDSNQESFDEARLGGIPGALDLDRLGNAVRTTYGNQEHAVSTGVEPRRLEIQLGSTQLIERQVVKVRSTGENQVLLFRRKREYGGVAEIFQPANGSTQTPRSAAQYGVRKGPRMFAANQIPQLAGPLELTIGDGARRGAVCLGSQAGAKVREIIERREQQPRSKPHVLARERARSRIATPHERPPIRLGPDRHDSWRVVPAPKPFVVKGRGGASHRNAGGRA